MEDESLVLVEDASAPSSPQRHDPASGLDIFHLHPSAPSPSSSLSPLASPFHPGDETMGRSKARRWADEDLDDSDAERSPVTSPTSYLDAVRQGSQLLTLPLLERAKPRLTPSNAPTERGKHPLAERARPANVGIGTHNSAIGAGVVHGWRNRRTHQP